jgi:hypothetical protein
MKKRSQWLSKQAVQCGYSINRTRITSLVLVSLLWMPPSFAGGLLNGPIITFNPHIPSTNDVIEVEVSGEWSDGCVPEYQAPFVRRNNRRIDVYSSTPAGTLCTMAITPWNFTVDVGYLPQGEYTVSVYINEQIVDHSFPLSVKNVSECDNHAIYSVTANRLLLPFVDIPLLDPATHQPTGEIAVFKGKLKMNKDNDFEILPSSLKHLKTTNTVNNKSCHAVYSYQDKTLKIPFLDVASVGPWPTFDELPPIKVFEVTLEHLQVVPLHLGVLRLDNYNHLYTIE